MKSSKSLIFFILVFYFISPVQSQKKLVLEDIYEKGILQAKLLSDFRFLNDGIHYTRLESGVIKKYNILTGEFVSNIFTASLFKNERDFNGEIEEYEFSPQENKIIIFSESESVYRHSTKNKVFIYDLSSQKLFPVFNNKLITNPSLSPDEQKVAFVFENNLYYQNLSNGKIIRITKDGQKNSIINGMCDWVYEEEFSFTKAYEWSPNGSYLAFIRFDETEVPEFTMEFYNDELYPSKETFKYPKVGEKNSRVKVLSFQIKSGKTKEVSLGSLDDMYIPRIKWSRNENQLCVFTLNRHQNHLKLNVCDVSSAKNYILYEEKNKNYIDIHDNLYFFKDGKHFLTTSEKGGYNHIYLYSMDGKIKTLINDGKYDVSALYGVDEKNRKIFFQASMKNPMESSVYSIDFDGKNLKELNAPSGYNSAQFSPTFDLFVLNKSTINTPPVFSVFKRDLSLVRILEDNKKLSEKQNEFGVSNIEFFEFTTSEGVPLNGWICKPKQFDANRKYPVFMTQYSGPGSQSVTNKWGGSSYWWHQLLAQNDYVVVCVDGRGTGNRGEEFKKMTYLTLGHYETIDQIETAKYISTLPFIDKNRIGIYGWSYGGFMSSLCILKGNDVFKSAIAVAPVTSWKWYDSVYTERYMKTLAENPEGYKENSPVYFADRLKGNYLLIHGMADDNVHFQHSVEMANALIKNKKQFDTYFYPNRNHGIYGNNARIHLFTKITNFIYEKI
ncbi:MAG: S9 family peptidase [Saprospiraceae bacterium]|nr:S9 family peptidase [Saprospiraceae bacterium]